MPKDEPAWKKTGLAEQRAVLELSKEKRSFDLWKKGQATQESYKDVVRLCRLCREKRRRAKAQTELLAQTGHLAIATLANCC